MIIEDGTGKGRKAKVNSDNKLEVSAVSKTEAAFVSDEKEKSFIMATEGFVSLTSGESGVLHLKYTGDEHLHISSIRTCGTGTQKWKMYKEVSGGTLLSAGTAKTPHNTDLSSANTVSSDVFIGTQGSTVTGGTVFENWINNGGHSIENFEGTLILKKNDSITLTCEVSASIDVCARIIFYEKGAN